MLVDATAELAFGYQGQMWLWRQEKLKLSYPWVKITREWPGDKGLRGLPMDVKHLKS